MTPEGINGYDPVKDRRWRRPRGAVLDPAVLRALQDAPAESVAVRYWPIWMPEYQTEFKDTTTRSRPWQLGHGEWVVSVVGVSGGVAVSHCALMPIVDGQGPKFRRS